MIAYNVRAEFSRFAEEIQTCIDSLAYIKPTPKFDNKVYETLNLVIQATTYLYEMCRKQSIHAIGFGETKAQPYLNLVSATNQLSTLRSLYMESSASKNIKPLKKRAENTLTKLYNSVITKAAYVVETSNEDKDYVNEPLIISEDGVYKSIPQAMQVLQDEGEKPKQKDELDYDTLNKKLALEKAMLEEKIEEGALIKGYFSFKGSVAINHFFKVRDLKGIPHSMFSFKGVEFSFNRRETIPPMFIFHEQLLIAFNTKKARFIFSKEGPQDYKSPGQIMADRRQEILDSYRNRNFINITQYTESGYLYSKAFKGLYFLWLATPETFNALGRFPENRTSLLWDNPL